MQTHLRIRNVLRAAHFTPDAAQTVLLEAGWCSGTPIADGNRLLPADRDAWTDGYAPDDTDSRYARQDLLGALTETSHRDDFESLLVEHGPDTWLLYAQAAPDTPPYAVLAAVRTTTTGTERTITHAAAIWAHGTLVVRFTVDDDKTLHPSAREAVLELCHRILSDRPVDPVSSV